MVEKSTIAMTSEISNRLPSSLAKIGPLRKLPGAGRLIPGQLATGMLSNIAAIIDASKKIVSAIIAPFNAIAGEIGKIGKKIIDSFGKSLQDINRVGDINLTTGIDISTINKFDSVFRTVGKTIADNTTIFSRIQRTINEGNLDLERRLANVGINLGEIRDSGEPVLELFLSVSEVLKNTEAGSIDAKVALESIGLTAENSLVGSMRRGREEIEQIITTSQAFGNSINPIVAKAGNEVRSLFSVFQGIGQTLRNDFIGQIFPEIRDVLKEVFEFFNSRSDSIRAFFVVTGKFVGNLVKVTSSFFKLFRKDSAQAAETARKVFSASFRSIGS